MTSPMPFSHKPPSSPFDGWHNVVTTDGVETFMAPDGRVLSAHEAHALRRAKLAYESALGSPFIDAGSIVITGPTTVVHETRDLLQAGQITGLPVAGYDKQVEPWKVDMLNENKVLEEKVLRRVDAHVRNRDSREIDQASVQIARRHVEDAFYRLNRAVMQPKRIVGDLA